MVRESWRKVRYNGQDIIYLLQRKPVKNVNLRIHPDGCIYVSADPRIRAEQVDEIVCSKGAFIFKALARFQELEKQKPGPRQFMTGEIFNILGKPFSLFVQGGEPGNVTLDEGAGTIYLTVKDCADFSERQKQMTLFIDRLCREVFAEVTGEIYPAFQMYRVRMPVLKVRTMKSRWGSCIPAKGIVTLNKRLLEFPRECIEYVVLHEFSHFIHPNHSKEFYAFIAGYMPDWKERRDMLKG
ncbi:SprT family zinc-dependent metalloprotease [Anaerolentibacter hominis]|uniref:M48 family metallopeptidase n=1 Tax=Anaerolentibacter hominis TaxID=3079009 RepID=UPI0031B898A2